MEPTTAEADGAVLVVTIHRPDVHNAVNHAALLGLCAAMDRLDSEPDLAVGVLTGAGGTFCAGADLRARVKGETVSDEYGFGSITRRWRDKPLIAAVEGSALGGGMELALACDLVVAAQDAQFGLPEVRHAILAAEGGLVHSASILGRMTAMQLALTGDPITAVRGHQLGLVNEITAPGAALARALTLARRIAEHSPDAARLSRQVIEAGLGLPTEQAWRLSDQAYAAVKQTPAYRTGARAFLDRHRPGPHADADATNAVGGD